MGMEAGEAAAPTLETLGFQCVLPPKLPPPAAQPGSLLPGPSQTTLGSSQEVHHLGWSYDLLGKPPQGKSVQMAHSRYQMEDSRNPALSDPSMRKPLFGNQSC